MTDDIRPLIPRAGERKKYLLFTAVALVSLVLDQVTKAWAADRLAPLGPQGLSVYGRNVVFLYAQNSGVAFSQFRSLSGGRIILSLVSMGALALVFSYLRKLPPTMRSAAVSLGLIFGGALGNVIDRVRLGKVTDFVLVDTGFWPFNPWPVFNVADVVLVAGVALLALGLLSTRQRPAALPR